MKRAELWLTYAWNDSFGAFLAIASTKRLDLGDKTVDVVASTIQSSEKDCYDWFDKLKETRADGGR